MKLFKAIALICLMWLGVSAFCGFISTQIDVVSEKMAEARR